MRTIAVTVLALCWLTSCAPKSAGFSPPADVAPTALEQSVVGVWRLEDRPHFTMVFTPERYLVSQTLGKDGAVSYSADEGPYRALDDRTLEIVGAYEPASITVDGDTMTGGPPGADPADVYRRDPTATPILRSSPAGLALARDVMRAYANIDRYFARWTMGAPEGEEGQAVFEVAFERATGRVFAMMTFTGPAEDGTMASSAQLFINDGTELHGVMIGSGAPMVGSAPTPEPMTYADIRGNMMFFFSVDLPLLFGVAPYYEWLSDRIVETTTTLPDRDGRIGLRVVSDMDALEAIAYVNPRTHIIEAFTHSGYEFHMALDHVEINRPLSESRFDFAFHSAPLIETPDGEQADE